MFDKHGKMNQAYGGGGGGGGGEGGFTGHQTKHGCSPIYEGFLTFFLIPVGFVD